MTKWMKRSAAGVLAAALVCGSTPASVLLGSGLTAFAAENQGVPISDISIIDVDYSPQTLVRGIQNTMTVNLRTYDKMANYINAKIDIAPYAYAGSEYDLSPYLTTKAQKPTESYSEEDEIYTYTFTLTFDLTNADAIENTSFDTYFYLCDKTNPDVRRYFANWYPQVAKGTQYEVSDDGSALEYAEFPIGESGTARQILISRDLYEWEDADSFDYRRDSYYYFKCDEADGTDTQTWFDNSDVHLYSLSESGEKTEIYDFPSTNFYDNSGRYCEARYVDNLAAGTYEVDYSVYADDAYDAGTQTIGTQTFTLSKTFTVGTTALDTDELHYDFGFINEKGERYQLDPEDVTEVPYSGDAYSLGYYNGDYWNWSVNLSGAVYDPQTDTYFEEGTDYIVSGDRGAIGVGAYSFTIEFINGYSGSKTFAWEIADFDDDAAPYIQMTDYPYTENNMPVYYYGTEIKPFVYNNDQDGDVTFFYAENKNSGVFSEEVPTEPGRYKVYAIVSANNGHEAYETYTATFQIVKNSLTVQPDDLTVTYGDALPELTYSFRTSMQSGYPTEDYEIGVYDDNGEEVTGKLNAGTYSLRVKNAPYSSSDKKHYDKSENYGTLTVLPKRASNIQVQVLPNIYTGSYQRPEFRVFADGEALVNTDSLTQYKLFGTTVAKNTGVYNAQIQLCGNYKGFKATQWEISDSELDITLGLDIVDVNMAEKKVQFALARVVNNLEVVSAGLIYTKTGADIADLTAEDFAAGASVSVNGREAKCASLSTATNTGVTKMRITDSGSGISIKGFIQYHCASGTFYAYTDVLTTDFESAVDQIAATTFNIKISDVDPDSPKVQFALTRSSQNVTPVECGFIYSKTGIKVDDIELGDPRIDGVNVKVSKSTNDAADLNLKQRITDAGSGISIRGYVKYLTSDGSERIAYTEDTLNTTYEEAYAAFMQS